MSVARRRERYLSQYLSNTTSERANERDEKEKEQGCKRTYTRAHADWERQRDRERGREKKQARKEVSAEKFDSLWWACIGTSTETPWSCLLQSSQQGYNLVWFVCIPSRSPYQTKISAICSAPPIFSPSPPLRIQTEAVSQASLSLSLFLSRTRAHERHFQVDMERWPWLTSERVFADELPD